jgi:hypothetical protein
MQWIARLMAVDYQTKPGTHNLHLFIGGEVLKPKPIVQLHSSISQVRPQPRMTRQPQLKFQTYLWIFLHSPSKNHTLIADAHTLDFYSAVKSTPTFQIAASRYYASLAKKFQFSWCSTTSTTYILSNTVLAIVVSLTHRGGQ